MVVLPGHERRVERPADERQRDRRDHERGGVDDKQLVHRQHDEQRARDERPEHAGTGERGLDPSVGRDEVGLIDEARDRAERRGLEEDPEGGRDEDHREDPPDAQHAGDRGDRHRSDRGHAQDVGHDHEPPPVGPVGPRADEQAEQEMRDREQRRARREVER